MELTAALLAFARRAVSRRAHHRSGRGRPVQHPGVPEALPAGPQRHGAADQPLHEGRGGAVPAGGGHRRRADHLRRLAGGIIDRFGGQKIISLEMLDGQTPAGLERYGELLGSEPPRIKLRVERTTVPEVLSQILANHSVVDVSVEDPPIEEVIAEMFKQAKDEGCIRPRRNLVDDPADQPRRTAGLPGRLCAGHADAVPAHRHAGLSLVGRVRGDEARPAAAGRSSATPTATSSPTTC